MSDHEKTAQRRDGHVSRVVQQTTYQVPRNSTPDTPQVSLNLDGSVVLCVTAPLGGAAKEERAAAAAIAKRRTPLSGEQVDALRALRRRTSSPEVIRAALALERYGLGESLDDVSRGTGYGPGWVRGLLKAFHKGGAEALETREYRGRRRGSCAG